MLMQMSIGMHRFHLLTYIRYGFCCDVERMYLYPTFFVGIEKQGDVFKSDIKEVINIEQRNGKIIWTKGKPI